MRLLHVERTLLPPVTRSFRAAGAGGRVNEYGLDSLARRMVAEPLAGAGEPCGCGAPGTGKVERRRKMALDCEDIIKNALGRNMSEDEIEEFARQGRRLARQVNARKTSQQLANQVRKATSQLTNAQAFQAMARERALALQTVTRAQAMKRITRDFQGREWDGINALLVGSMHMRKGARYSVDAVQTSLTGHYLGGLFTDIQKLGAEAWKLFSRGTMERDIARAMFAIDNPKVTYRGPKLAMDIGRAIHKWQEVARVDANNAGAWIGKLPGYVVRQSHDPLKLGKYGREEWKDFIGKRLDWDVTAEGKYAGDADGQEGFLNATYDALLTGVHFRSQGVETNQLATRSGVGSTAAGMSQERVLHFTDGDAWFDYNLKFGHGNLNAAVVAGLSKSAKDTGLMRLLGPSPRANLELIIKETREGLAKALDTKGLEALRKAGKGIYNRMDEVDGGCDVPGNPKLAAAGRNLRAIESMAKLGGAVISGFSDIPTFAMEFAYHGKGFWGSMLEGIRGALKGRGSVEQQRILSCLGVFYDSMSGSVAARFSGADMPGKLSAMQNQFFRLNGLSLWTDCFKKSVSLMMSHDLALERGLGWEALSGERKRLFELYDIDEGLWEMARRAPMDAADGRQYFTPEVARHFEERDIERWHKERGLAYTKEAGERFRGECEEKFRCYFRDRLGYAVLEPDAKTRATVYQGLKPGTVAGEVLRCVMQFKSFSAVFMQRTMGRELFGRGADSLKDGLLGQFVKSRYGDRNHLAEMFVMTTLFGLGSMTVKQLLAGKTPRDPSDYKTWIAAAAQGGGLGIFGDYLFGEASRMGDSFLSSVAGPVMGSASSLMRLYYDAKEGVDTRSNAFRFIFNHLPGNNLFWLRAALDHLVCFNVYEKINPGYLRRMQRRVRKENNQTFFWKPEPLW